MRGDRVEVVIDAGDDTRTYEIEATRAGRRVEITHGRGLVEVTETTRGGTRVRTSWPTACWRSSSTRRRRTPWPTTRR
jgi:hypothetical protein